MANDASVERIGSYRLIAELGHGGMADVFLGVIDGPPGSGFTKLAVLKRLRSHLADDPQFVAMLRDEARITAMLDHPNVVKVYELGRDGSEWFLAMEYLAGQPLHRIERRAARRGTQVPREVYYAILADVLAGLHHAHELKDFDGTPLSIVHRDVTPQNVFVTYSGTVKVVDFGFAKAAGRETQTEFGIRKGKVRYMSPEQATGGPLNRKTDIFAAGVLLWNLSTGRRLWEDKTEIEITQALRTGDFPASPRSVRPDVPEAIDAICRRALAVRPEDRYATAEAMRTDIERTLQSGALEARRTLKALMDELFETDRQKQRQILDDAHLTRHASSPKLRSAMRRATPTHMNRSSTAGPSMRQPPSATSSSVKRPKRRSKGKPAKWNRHVLYAISIIVALVTGAAVATIGAALFGDAPPPSSTPRRPTQPR